MKTNFNLFYVFCLFAGFSVLISCGNDDDGIPRQERIVGTWNYHSMDHSVTINGIDFISLFMQMFGVSQSDAEEMGEMFFDEEPDEMLGSSFTFNADGTYVFLDGVSEDETGRYILENNDTQLTLIPDDDETIVLDISELTNNRLTLDFNEEESGDLTGDGEDDTLVVSMQVTFVR